MLMVPGMTPTHVRYLSQLSSPVQAVSYNSGRVYESLGIFYKSGVHTHNTYTQYTQTHTYVQHTHTHTHTHSVKSAYCVHSNFHRMFILRIGTWPCNLCFYFMTHLPASFGRGSIYKFNSYKSKVTHEICKYKLP